MLNRVKHGTKDAAQFFILYFERTMEKIDHNIGVLNLCVCANILPKTSVY